MLKYIVFRWNLYKVMNLIDKQRKSSDYKGEIRVPLREFNKTTLKYINYIYRFHLQDVKIISKIDLSENLLVFKAYPNNLDWFRNPSYSELSKSLELEDNYLSVEIQSQMNKQYELSKKVASLFEDLPEESPFSRQSGESQVIHVDFHSKKRIK